MRNQIATSVSIYYRLHTSILRGIEEEPYCISKGGIEMLLFYCKECEYHEIIDVEGHKHSKCYKENRLAIYTKCLTDEAVKQFIDKDKQRDTVNRNPALEICYKTA